MHLSPKDIDKLVLHNAGFLAQKRYARGLKLNYPETVALIATQLLEFIRDGQPVADLMDNGKRILGYDDVMEGVADMIHEVQVEGTFPDGTKLVTVHKPVCRKSGDTTMALYGSGLVRQQIAAEPDNITNSDPGSYVLSDERIKVNESRVTIELDVVNKGDRPVQVGSHYPFFETNPQLSFDRGKSFGFRLNIPAGTAVRFEPGEKKTVHLVTIGGNEIVYGGNNLVAGPINEANKGVAMERMKSLGFENDPK